jgi:RNA polymerase sigma-70 factor (ECF subfamily)
MKILNDPTPSQGTAIERRTRDLAVERDAIERVLDGDVSAYRRLVDRHARRVHAIAYRMLGSTSDADDVTQQAFVAAFDALEDFDPSLPFSSWINRIAINLAKDQLKSKKRTEVSLPDGLPDSAAHLGGRIPDPEGEAERGELRSKLEEALASLSVKDREVLVLKDVEELSYQEMRDVLRRPITALKIRVIRARLKLRGVLQKMEDGDGA